MPDYLVEFGRGVAIVLALGLVFAFLGVYGTNGQPFLERFILWTFTMAVGALASVFITPIVFEREPYASWSLWIQLPVTAAIIALPVTIAIILMEASDGQVMSAKYWPLQFFYVFVISQVITIGGYLLQYRSKTAETSPGIQAIEDPASKFLQRLPARYRGAVLYGVSSEDHYLRVHTSLGEELILMRLADAISALEQADGLQVHRSWWIARQGIADVKRENGKPLIELKSGGTAPVSRTYQKAARDAGLI
ncbi:MAG: LytTR family transcriptional regulator [Hyphomonadaceae bacterium]|nr:LytTR family transcriptional regulator [Hyphomonadaceae bacterium]